MGASSLTTPSGVTGLSIRRGPDLDLDLDMGICGRTEGVRDAIVASIEGVSDCASVTAADMAAVTDPLVVASLTSLQAGDFAGLSGLRSLRLGGSGLTALPSGAFAGLSGLTFLVIMADTGVTALPADVFAGLASLNTLNIRRRPAGQPAVRRLRRPPRSDLLEAPRKPADRPAGGRVLGPCRTRSPVARGQSRRTLLLLDTDPGAHRHRRREPGRARPRHRAVPAERGRALRHGPHPDVEGGAASPDTVTIPAGDTVSPAVQVEAGGSNGRVTVRADGVMPAGFQGIAAAGEPLGLDFGRGSTAVYTFMLEENRSAGPIISRVRSSWARCRPPVTG